MLQAQNRLAPVGGRSRNAWATHSLPAKSSHVFSSGNPLARQSSLRHQQQQQVVAHSGDGNTSEITTVKLLGISIPSTLYLGMQLGELVLLIMLADAAYSGDWSRIGAISKSTELVLQKIFLFISVAHAGTGILAARLAPSRGLNPVWIGIRGFLFGSLEVNRVTQVPEVTKP